MIECPRLSASGSTPKDFAKARTQLTNKWIKALTHPKGPFGDGLQNIHVYWKKGLSTTAGRTLLKRADQALYAAKAAGRNRVAHEPETLVWR